MRVLFFAQARDAAECAELNLSVEGSLSEEEFWDSLAAVAPGVVALRSSVRLAQNGEYTVPGTRFSDADEVALIPPVSGG